MNSPKYAPILLSPCGHTFCCQCVTMHITTHQKDNSNNGNPIDVARCPCCRQDILSQSLNISLQTMITNMITLKNKLQKVEQKNIQFSNKLYETQMRCNILQEELLKCTKFKQKLEKDITTIDLVIQQLHCHQKNIVERFQLVSYFHVHFGTLKLEMSMMLCTITKSYTRW
ncbi:hypothetical protein BDL97_02G022100 [Sphagnum fallax]|nr:hypothetical protein BDL97_02G022100 [Sphagnum fallax]